MPVYLPGLTAGGLGYGGAAYGYSPYGSAAFPRPPVAVDGGFGGQQYGYNSYGSVDIIPPTVTGANALDGFQVEIFFSEEMGINAALLLATNYTFVATFGVPLTTVSVVTGTAGSLGGVTSVIATHSGSTLGGEYIVTATNMEDLAGNILVSSSTSFKAFGDATTVSTGFPSPDDGRTLRLDFKTSAGAVQDLLTEVQFTPGVDSTSSYALTTTYPVVPTLSSPTQDPTLLSQVDIDVHPMTSTTYGFTVGPSLVYDYTGTVLPDADPNLTGVQVGTGTSIATTSDGLVLSKLVGATFGWQFEDTSGRLLPATSFRVDFKLDVSSATITPAVFNATLATLAVTDGAVELSLTLDDVAGTKSIGISSGALSGSVPAAWDAGEVTITLIRNIQASFYTLLVDGVPLFTTSIASANGAPTFSAGTSVVMGPTHAVTLFKLKQVLTTASSTLFTSSWNFIHNLSAPFTGSAVLTRDRIFTKRGPLVRGWGDNTPARKEDVEVRVGGTAVVVGSINPYVGEIVPAIPIPLSAPGTVTVEVDYIWFQNPAMGMLGLNTPGLGLNIWDRRVGHTPGAVSPTPATSMGAIAGNRFPMGVLLAPVTRKSPKAIGHRYIGFQKGGYSALLNEPTTLLLNQNPHAISVGGVSASAIRETGTFDGQTTPQTAETPWTLDGVDSGGLVGDGTWRVVDASSGSFGTGTATIYERDLDLNLPTVVTEAARFEVETYTADGVFTGVGFGIHDGLHLLVVGALVVSDVQHVGVLLDGDNPQLETSWKIGPGAIATADSTTQVTIALADLPAGVESGGRFRIATGAQTGVYEIAACGLALTSDGAQAEIDFTPAPPADIDLVGNNIFEILFETKWDANQVSLRVMGEWPAGSVEVTLGGTVSGTVATITELAPYPAQTALLLPNTKDGVAFWGSISRRAVNSSLWDFAQYASNPERMIQTVQGLTAQTEMNVLPEDDPNDPWSIVGGFGFAFVDAGGDHTVLKSTSGSEDATIDLEYSYRRIEPYFSARVSNDVEAKFRVESGNLGAGDVAIILNDGVRKITFKPLLYTQGNGIRKLVTDLPQSSLSGLLIPTTDGWSVGSGSTLSDPTVRGQTLEFTKLTTQTGSWSQSLANPTTVGYEGLIAESRIEVTSGTNGSVGVGAYFGARVLVSSVLGRVVLMTFDTAGNLLLVDANLTTVATIAFNWDDSAPHTYRMLLDPVADSVVLVVDDVVMSSTALSSFTSEAASTALAFVGADGSGAATWTMHSTSVIPLRSVANSGETLGRTFGILLRGGTETSINGYAIPRADTSGAANSSLSAIPVIMDWQSYCHCRLYYDPEWGVSFYRPDLALPPWYTGGDFATQTTDPTASWITVEYASLPVDKVDRGCVQFGPIDPRAISQSRWDFMRYRIRGYYSGFGIAPQNMVINRSFTFTSGEWNIDVTPEVKTITSRTATLLRVSDSAIYADRIFVVQVDGSVLPSTDYGFDASTQNLIFNSALPGAQYPVTVTFAAAQPVTKEYLCTQPFTGSVTVLNEGTPPMPKSRDGEVTTQVTAGSKINDPTDVLDDAESLILNDPYRYVEYEDPESSFYTGTEFCEVEDGDDVYIAIACDEGIAEIGLEGPWSSEELSNPEGPAGPWGGQSPSISGSASKFNTLTTLFVSGGGFSAGGVLGGGVAPVSGTTTPVMYPNGRGPDWEPLALGVGFGFNQDFVMVLEDVTPRAEVFDLASLMGDNVPPTSADPTTDPNVDGTPGVEGNGAAAYIMEDFSPSTFSRLGPWGGLATLSVRSLLSGGAPQASTALILQGGSPLPIVTTITSGNIEAAN